MSEAGALLGPSGSVLGIRLLGAALQAAAVIVIARTYSREAVGAFAVVWSVWVIARLIGPLGFDQASLRYLSMQGEPLRQRQGYAMWQVWRVARFNLAFAAPVALWGAALFAANIEVGLLIAICALGAPFAALQGLMAAQNRAFGHPVGATLPESVGLPIAIVLVAGLTRLAPDGPFTLAASQLLVVFCVLIMYVAKEPWRVHTQPMAPDNSHEHRELANAMAPALAASALSSRGPILLISTTLGLGPSALFDVAQRLQNIGAMPTSSIAVVASPIFARHAAQERYYALRRQLLLAGALACGPALIAAALLGVLGHQVLSLFGPAYVHAETTAIILLIASGVNGFFGMSSNALSMIGRAKVVRSASIAQLTFVLVAVPIGCVTVGLEGAAVAVLAAVILRDCTLWAYVLLLIRSIERKP